MNFTCPYCFADHDTISGLDVDHPELPDPTLCSRCGAWLITDANGLRKPTASEQQRIVDDPVCRAIKRTWLVA
jgi:hypothetical protein